MIVDVNYSDEKTTRLSREAALALVGQPLTVADRLKLTGTQLLAILDEEQSSISGYLGGCQGVCGAGHHDEPGVRRCSR